MVKEKNESGIDLSKLDPALVEMPMDLVGNKGGRDAEPESKRVKDSDSDSKGSRGKRGRTDENERQDEDKRTSEDEEDFDNDGYDQDGFDKDGYDQDGFDKDGRHREDDESDNRDLDTSDRSRDDGRNRERSGGDHEVFGTLMSQLGQLQAEIAQLKTSGGGRQTNDVNWEKLEADTGLGKPALELLLGSTQTVHQNIMSAVDKRMARIERRMILNDVSKERGFEGAMRYEKQVEEFFKDLPSHMQGNEKMIRFAVQAAMGSRRSEDLNRDRWSREQRRRVVQRFQDRNVDRGGNKGTRSESKRGEVAELERKIRSRFGISESEQRKWKTGRR